MYCTSHVPATTCCSVLPFSDLLLLAQAIESWSFTIRALKGSLLEGESSPSQWRIETLHPRVAPPAESAGSRQESVGAAQSPVGPASEAASDSLPLRLQVNASPSYPTTPLPTATTSYPSPPHSTQPHNILSQPIPPNHIVSHPSPPPAHPTLPDTLAVSGPELL